MAVMIRLARQGAKKKPNFLIVVVDKAGRRDGECLEKLGQYFPKAKATKEKIKIDLDALKKWQDRGAIMTQTVGQLVKALAK